MSIYIDAENSPFSEQQLTAFLALVNAEIGSRRADRIYYMDANHNSNVAHFRGTYHKAGFRLVDVPHESKAAPKRKDGTQTVNAVDVAMAVDVIERAVRGPEHQTIILVTADRDYFPLLRRLRELGHDVKVWARSPASGFRKACDMLGCSVRDLDKEPSLWQKQPAIAIEELSPPFGTIDAISRPLSQPLPVNEQAVAILEGAVDATWRKLRELAAAGESPNAQRIALRNWLNSEGRAAIEPLAYPVKDAGGFWIEHLKAFDLLPGDSGISPLAPRTNTSHDAAVGIERLLREVTQIVLRLAHNSPNATVKLTVVGQQLDTSSLLSEQDSPQQLHALLHNAMRLVTNMQCFVWCARALGMLQFTETENLNRIIVRSELTMPESSAPA